MNHLYFIRHGQSRGNAESFVADASSHLTPLGVTQAEKSGQELKSLSIDLIVSSPMTRARQTAETISEQIGLSKEKIVILEELRERGLGGLENKPKEKTSEWYFETAEGFGMETLEELRRRMKIALEKVKVLATDFENVLLVGHSISGGVLANVREMGNAEYLEIKL